MNASFREILERLNDHQVEYLIVGGVAAVIHGAPVTTFDLDALVRVSAENASRLVRVFSELDARYREHDTVVRPTKEHVLAGGHMLLMTSAGPLDVLGLIGKHESYDDLVGASTEFEMGSGTCRVLNLEELIRQKRATNRAKDRAVLELLDAVLAKRREDD